MASITREKNGRKTIQFYGSDGKRRSIRLGKMSVKDANTFKLHLENLVAHQITRHALSNTTAHWLADLDPKTMGKLTAVGLIAPRESMELKEYCEDYYRKRTDLKPGTLKKYRSTMEYLYKYFGENRILRDITPGDADEWRLWLGEQPGINAENTIRKHCAVAKVFFYAAIRKKLIQENPFEDLKATVIPNKSRDYFITMEDAEKVLKYCPDPEWKLIFAMARYGGLRTPSETLALRWEDINWEEGRFYVRSPKTERHEGKEGRIVPIFPQLRPYLDACYFDDRPSEYVIVNRRLTSMNLRTTMKKIITRAGVNPWPKLFQNLRSTRETELLQEGFPLQTVVAWLGNSPSVALKSYLQVREEDYQKALRKAVRFPVVSSVVALDAKDQKPT